MDIVCFLSGKENSHKINNKKIGKLRSSLIKLVDIPSASIETQLSQIKSLFHGIFVRHMYYFHICGHHFYTMKSVQQAMLTLAYGSACYLLCDYNNREKIGCVFLACLLFLQWGWAWYMGGGGVCFPATGCLLFKYVQPNRQFELDSLLCSDD